MTRIVKVVMASLVLGIGFLLNRMQHNQATVYFDASLAPLNVINLDTLTLKSIDDECGEWGGNVETVFVYRDMNKRLTAFYEYESMDCEALQEENPITKTVSMSYVLDSRDEQLISDAILELVKMKLQNKRFVSHAGIVNIVSFGYNELLIEDFPSVKWNGFENLKARILGE